MRKELALLTILIISLASVLATSYYVQPVKAVYNVLEIYINADGSITPSDAPITNAGNSTYTLTDDVNITGAVPRSGVAIHLNRGNITFNGNGHTIMNSGGYDCFVVGYGTNNVTIENTTAIGFNICLYIDSDNCTIKGNTFSGSGYLDVVRLDSASNNYFEGNNITNSGGSCVWMYHYPGLNNIFVNNYIVNSGAWPYDVAIGRNLGGGGSTFYHNVIGGRIEATYTPACTWDNGYPSGGNYWIGYTSTDKFSGPGQNITGSDGIGDTPLVIDSDDIDHYPFMMIDIRNVTQIPSRNNVFSTDMVEVNATVTHYFPLGQVILNCTYTNGTATWIDAINMTNLEGDIWNGIIPASPAGTNVTYVIIAQDNTGSSINTTRLGYTFDYPVIIPEFSTIMLLPILFVTTLIAALVFKRKRIT